MQGTNAGQMTKAEVSGAAGEALHFAHQVTAGGMQRKARCTIMARFFLNQARKAARCQHSSTSAARSALTAPAQSRVAGTSRVLHRWHFSPGFSFVFCSPHYLTWSTPPSGFLTSRLCLETSPLVDQEKYVLPKHEPARVQDIFPLDLPSPLSHLPLLYPRTRFRLEPSSSASPRFIHSPPPAAAQHRSKHQVKKSPITPRCCFSQVLDHIVCTFSGINYTK